MAEPTIWMLLLVQALALGVAGLVGAWAAGRVGTAPMAGAVLAGILIGPSVLGQVAPQTYRSLFVGGGEQIRELEQFQEEAREDRQALVDSGVTEIAIEEHDAATERRVAELREQAEAARGPHGETLAAIAMVGILFVMLSATRGVANLGAWRDRLPLALSIGAGSAALAAVTAAVLVAGLAWAGRFDAPALWIAGIAIGSAAAATPIPAALLERPGGHELDAPLLQITAWFITFLLLAILATLTAVAPDAGALGYLSAAGSALALIVVALAIGPMIDAATERFVAPTSEGSRTPPALTGFAIAAILLVALVVVGPTLAAVALAAFAAASALRRSHNAHASISGAADRAAQGFFSPMLMALAGVHVHLLTDFDWLLLLAVLIAYGDGKAIGAVLVGRGSNFPWRIGLKSGAALVSGSATPVTLALLLLLTGLIDGRAYTALVLAALVSAAFALPLMRAVDQTFEPAEPLP